MKLIVGLGNPGEKYKDTRHNVGFMVLDKLSGELDEPGVTWQRMDKVKAHIAVLKDVILVKPDTYMNESGIAVRAVTAYYKIPVDDVWVVHDDLDLPLGKIRIRRGGASAGHHGIDSLIRELKSDQFVRIRLGIGRGKTDKKAHTDRKLHQSKVVRFVLSRFGRSEAGDLKHLVKHSVAALRAAFFEGIDKAMNQFN